MPLNARGRGGQQRVDALLAVVESCNAVGCHARWQRTQPFHAKVGLLYVRLDRKDFDTFAASVLGSKDRAVRP